VNLDGLGAGHCLLCRHCLADDDRIWCGLYGTWITSPSLDGMDCPSYEEAA
jgi:hypothetical protein